MTKPPNRMLAIQMFTIDQDGTGMILSFGRDNFKRAKDLANVAMIQEASHLVK
jgi:hypothetical protein